MAQPLGYQLRTGLMTTGQIADWPDLHPSQMLTGVIGQARALTSGQSHVA